MGILMIKRNIRRKGVGFFSNFSYSGEMVKDLSQGQPRIQFLTSGILIPKSSMTIDAWLLGGGGGGAGMIGGGGGSGTTVTERGIELAAGNRYEIIIGSGGNAGSSEDSGWLHGHIGGIGKTTEAFGYRAWGGDGGGSKSFQGGIRYAPACGGHGGSGGGAGSRAEGGKGGAGGKDGGNGEDPSNGGYYGVGNRDSTTEFGEGGKLYASGGSGGSHDGTVIPASEGGGGATGEAGQPNTGGGGGGADNTRTAGAGGSGIVVIRKAV